MLRASFIGPTVGQREAPIITDSVIERMTPLGGDLRAVIVDLSDVTMLASMGLGSLIDIRNRAKQVKAKAILCGARPEIEQVIRMMRIDRLYTIASSADEVNRLAA